MKMRNHTVTNNDIHVIDPEQHEKETKVSGYTLKGVSVSPNDVTCLAKQNGNLYYLKYATVGADAGHLFNPHSPNHAKEINWKSILANGKAFYEFRKVTKTAFDLYLHYLKTGEIQSLRHAEREIY